MPQIKSAIKRVQVAERNRKRNIAFKSSIRTAVKRVREAIADKQDRAEILNVLKTAYSLIDRAVCKGIVHKKTGARYKARLMKAVNAATAAA